MPSFKLNLVAQDEQSVGRAPEDFLLCIAQALGMKFDVPRQIETNLRRGCDGGFDGDLEHRTGLSGLCHGTDVWRALKRRKLLKTDLPMSGFDTENSATLLFSTAVTNDSEGVLDSGIGLEVGSVDPRVRAECKEPRGAGPEGFRFERVGPV